jgi:hypothetical protein
LPEHVRGAGLRQALDHPVKGLACGRFIDLELPPDRIEIDPADKQREHLALALCEQRRDDRNGGAVKWSGRVNIRRAIGGTGWLKSMDRSATMPRTDPRFDFPLPRT